MSGDPRFLDPELHELVAEAAAAGGVSPALAGTGPLSLEAVDELLGGGTARPFELAGAERELLATHRDEVAWLLRQTWLREVYGDSRRRLSRSLRVDRDHDFGSEDAWRRRRDHDLDVTPAEAGVEDGLDLLGRWILGGERRPATYRLVLVANRIAPSDAARIHLAYDLAQAGDTRSGLKLLQSVLAVPQDELLGSLAYENLGWVHGRRGEEREAMVAYRESALLAEDRPVPLAHWLLRAARLGDRQETLAAAARLDRLVGIDHPAVRAVREGYALEREEGEWRPPSGAGAFAASVRANLGPASMKVLDVLS